MRPVALLYERDRFVIVHECTACHTTHRNRAASSDDLSVLLG